MQGTTSLTNHGSQSLTANTRDGSIKSSGAPVFILCDRCYWCATYFGNTRIPTDNICPQCSSNLLNRVPIVPNEAFTFNHNEKHGVELEFKHR